MDVIQPVGRPFSGTLCVTNSNTYFVGRYIFDTVAATNGEALFCLPVETAKGQLVDVKVQSASEKFNVYLLPFSTSKKDSISVIYQKMDVNKFSIERNLNCLWTKYSQPDLQHSPHMQSLDLNLYLLLENAGAVETGQIIVEITIMQLA